MKGLVAFGFLLFCGSTLFGNKLTLPGNASDTTVTSFEIYLKRKSSDNPVGFNTCNIDRLHIYNIVMERLSGKFETRNFLSVHKPLVLMKFHDVTGKAHHNKNHIADDVAKSMKGHQYNYFIKIYGNLDVPTAHNQFQKATFTLRVYIFDENGTLIAKSKSKSREGNLAAFQNSPNQEENYPVNEEEFFELVSDAASTLEISI
jgi:hypothetical protein